MFSPLLLLIILYLSILSWRFVGLSHCLGRFHRGWVTCLSFLLFVILLLRCTWDLAKSISLFVTNETTFVISTASSTSTFTTEQISASAATSGSVIWIFLHLTHTHTHTYIYIYIYITFATLVFWHSMWNLLILHSAFHLYTYVRNRGNKCALCECRHFR